MLTRYSTVLRQEDVFIYMFITACHRRGISKRTYSMAAELTCDKEKYVER